MPTPKQMLIIQHLVSSPTHNKNAIFLTKQQAQEKLDKMLETHDHGTIITHNIRLGDTKYYFFSNDHLFGYKDEKNKLLGVTPVTSYLPMAVTPREGLEDGVIYTVDDYIKIFYKEDTLINSFDELVEFIEKHNLLIAE